MKKASRELTFADDGQTYAQVTKMLGHCRVMAKTETAELMCKIRGNMQKRVYVRPGDWVLIASRDFSEDVADIIAKYEPAEIAYLKRIGEIKVPVEVEAEEDIVFEDDDIDVDNL